MQGKGGTEVTNNSENKKTTGRRTFLHSFSFIAIIIHYQFSSVQFSTRRDVPCRAVPRRASFDNNNNA